MGEWVYGELDWRIIEMACGAVYFLVVQTIGDTPEKQFEIP